MIAGIKIGDVRHATKQEFIADHVIFLTFFRS